ncbi:MAG: hypothetical protein ACOY4Q_01850 [Bacillota bacterium]
MTKQNGPDPFAFYKQYCEMNEEAWAKMVEQAMASDSFASAMGQQINVYLNFLQALKKSAEGYCEALQLPKEQDIVRLSLQIINLEQKIDSLEKKLGDIEQLFRGEGA